MNNKPTRQLASAILLCATICLAAGCGLSTGDEGKSSTQQAPAQQWNPGDESPTTESSPSFEQPTAKPPTPETTLPEEQAAVNRRDPAAVAAATVKIWFTWDTGRDPNPSAAVARSAPLLADAFRTQVLATASLQPTAQWLIWSAQNAVVTATATPVPNQGAPDSPTRRYFIFDVTQTGHDTTHHQIGDPVRTQVWVITTTRADGTWQVSQLEQQQ